MTSAVDVIRFCVTCGKDKRVDPVTFSCPTCGRPTKTVTSTGASISSNGTGPSQSAIRLPSTNASRKWLEQTQALAESFAQAAKEAEKRAADATAEAERLRRAAAAFTGLLPQVSVEEGLPKATRGAGLNGRWSRSHERCERCGRVDRKHRAHGLCTTCYDKPKGAGA